MAVAGQLFELDLPPGLRYVRDLIDANEERRLIDDVSHVAFSDFEMRGAIARRRVAFYGETYGSESAAAFPPFLIRLRDVVARWAVIEPDAFAMALINEYRPGTPIGWHRDAPQYGVVAGVSLLSPCPMKFRPYHKPGHVATGPRRATHEIVLEPRSAYLMTGPSRAEYEHHIPPVKELRYSITFRTLRGRRG